MVADRSLEKLLRRKKKRGKKKVTALSAPLGDTSPHNNTEKKGRVKGSR